MSFVYNFSQMNAKDKEIYQQIYEGLCAYSPRIKINRTSREQACELYAAVLNDHPELSIVDNSALNFEYNAVEFYLLPGYWFCQQDIYNNHMQFLEECEFIVNKIVSPSMPEIEREIAIHDFLCRNIEYGYYDTDNNMGGKLSQSAFCTLFERKGVCKGISMLFKCLMDLADIKTIVIEGEINDSGWEPHAWNIVLMNNHFSHVDITKDICIYRENDIMAYHGFNFSDGEANGKYRWNHSQYPVCDSNVNGYYEWKHLIINDEIQMENMIDKSISKGSRIIQFKIQKGSYLSCFSKENIAQKIVDYISQKTQKDILIKYIFDENSGKVVVEVE
ncbi:MAG: hypothetical protein K2N80_08760 [Lachnospiraceae bacterium]|nr:hypothetical protein [Lachnospiraceae bacterium]